MELKQLVSINGTAAMEMIHGRARCSTGCTICIIQAPAALPEDGAARRACELSALRRPALLTAGWGAVFPCQPQLEPAWERRLGAKLQISQLRTKVLVLFSLLLSRSW